MAERQSVQTQRDTARLRGGKRRRISASTSSGSSTSRSSSPPAAGGGSSMISIEAELDTDPDWIGMIVGLERLLVGKRLPSGQRKRKEEERESRQDLILAALEIRHDEGGIPFGLAREVERTRESD
uniref:Uncharacterized protein n=1 Tax=Oryza nivara TaxID=4536 RepID=A0A0E0GGG1_ORYNI